MDRQEWIEERRKHVGASDVAAILGVDPHRGPLSVYEAKVTGYSMADNEWLKYGRDIEGAIANMYEAKTGRPVFDLGATTFQSDSEFPFLAATLDRVTQIDDSDFPLELKSVDPFGAKTTPDKWREDPPLHFQIQLQMQMACTGSEKGSLAALFPGYNLVWVDIERDQEFIESAYEEIKRFWAMVVSRTPPPPDSHSSSIDVLKRLYSQENGKTIIAFSDGGEILKSCNDWEFHKKEATFHSTKAKVIEAELRARMKNNTFALLNDGTMLTLKTTKRKGYAVKETSYRVLRRTSVNKL